MNEEAFRALAAAAWDAVPQEWKARIDNVALIIEDEPSAEVRKEEGLTEHETLLGRYHGIPDIERGGGYGVGGTLPDTITLYRLPIIEEGEELMAKHRFAVLHDAVTEALRETLWHEIGHYLGLSEEEVRAREHEGTNRFTH